MNGKRWSREGPGGWDKAKWSGSVDNSWHHNGWEKESWEGNNQSSWVQHSKEDTSKDGWQNDWYSEDRHHGGDQKDAAHDNQKGWDTSTTRGSEQDTSTPSTLTSVVSSGDGAQEGVFQAAASPDAAAAEQQPSSGSKPRRTGPRQQMGARLWCHIFLNKRHPDFDLVPMLIGRGGRNMREIFAATNAKIRVRGRGSGHLEVDGNKEAPVPLMIAVTSDGGNPHDFNLAVTMTITKLDEVTVLFTEFCQQRNLGNVCNREGLWRFGEMSKEAENVLKDLIPPDGLAIPPGIRLDQSSVQVPVMKNAAIAKAARSQKQTPTANLHTAEAAAVPGLLAMPNQQQLADAFPAAPGLYGPATVRSLRPPGRSFEAGLGWPTPLPHDGGYGGYGGYGYGGYGAPAALGAIDVPGTAAPFHPAAMPPGLWGAPQREIWDSVGTSAHTAESLYAAQPHMAAGSFSAFGQPAPSLEATPTLSRSLAASLHQKEKQAFVDYGAVSEGEDEADLQGLIESEVSAFLQADGAY